MVAKQHGTRRRYNEGCRCEDCKAASRAYWLDYRARKAAGEPTHSGVPAAAVVSIAPAGPVSEGPGAVEVAVNLELEGLAQAEARPGLTQTALALARIMDNPKALNQQPAAAAKLVEVLDKLRKGADAKKSRLASVRDMTKPHSATG